MKGQRKRYTRIEGLSEQRRLPRLGKIHLGVKKTSSKGNEYPSAVDYFVCPPEVQAVYGEKPKELDIMLPVEDANTYAPMAYKYYKSGVGLFCTGNGQEASRVGEGGAMIEMACPCDFYEQGKCKRMMNFLFILPKVSIGGCYQVDTSSVNSILDIQSGIDFARSYTGRIAMIPMKLRLSPNETTAEGKKKIIHTMSVALGSHDEIRKVQGFLGDLRQLVSGGPQIEAAPPDVSTAPGDPVEETDLVPEKEQSPPSGPQQPPPADSTPPEGGDDFLGGAEQTKTEPPPYDNTLFPGDPGYDEEKDVPFPDAAPKKEEKPEPVAATAASPAPLF